MNPIDTTVTIPAQIVKDIQLVTRRLLRYVVYIASPVPVPAELMFLTQTIIEKFLSQPQLDGTLRRDVHDVVSFCEFLNINAPAFDGVHRKVARKHYLLCRANLGVLAVPAWVTLHPEAMEVIDSDGNAVSNEVRAACVAQLVGEIASGEQFNKSVHMETATVCGGIIGLLKPPTVVSDIFEPTTKVKS